MNNAWNPRDILNYLNSELAILISNQNEKKRELDSITNELISLEKHIFKIEREVKSSMDEIDEVLNIVSPKETIKKLISNKIYTQDRSFKNPQTCKKCGNIFENYNGKLKYCSTRCFQITRKRK